MRKFGYGRNRAERYKLMVPYLVVVALIGVVGYQATSHLFAQSLTGGNVQLTVGQNSYVVGQPVRFTLSNQLDQTVYVTNNCPGEPLEVYRQVSGQWTRLHDTADYTTKCADEPRQYGVPAHGQTSASYIYWPHLFNSPGHYRLVAPIQGYDDQPSVEFDVVAAQ